MQRLRLELAQELQTQAIREQGLGRSWFWASSAAVTVADFAREIYARYQLSCPGGASTLRLLLLGCTLPPEAPIGLLRDGDLIEVQPQQQQLLQQQQAARVAALPGGHAAAVAGAATAAVNGGAHRGKKRKRGSGAAEDGTDAEVIAAGGLIPELRNAGGSGAAGQQPAQRAAKVQRTGPPGQQHGAVGPHADGVGGEELRAPAGTPAADAVALLWQLQDAEAAAVDAEVATTIGAAGSGQGAADGAAGAPMAAKRASRSARRKAAKRRLKRTGVLPYNGTGGSAARGAARGQGASRKAVSRPCGGPQGPQQQQQQQEEHRNGVQQQGQRSQRQPSAPQQAQSTQLEAGNALPSNVQQATADLLAAALAASPLNPNASLPAVGLQTHAQPYHLHHQDMGAAATGTWQEQQDKYHQQRQQQGQPRPEVPAQRAKGYTGGRGNPARRVAAEAAQPPPTIAAQPPPAATAEAAASAPKRAALTTAVVRALGRQENKLPSAKADSTDADGSSSSGEVSSSSKSDGGDGTSSSSGDGGDVQGVLDSKRGPPQRPRTGGDSSSGSSSEESSSSSESDSAGGDSDSDDVGTKGAKGQASSQPQGGGRAATSSTSDSSSAETSSSSSSSSSSDDGDGISSSDADTSSSDADGSKPPPQTKGPASAPAPGGAPGGRRQEEPVAAGRGLPPPPMAAIDYDSLPAVPGGGQVAVGDVLAYKLLEIGADMCPRVSSWRRARVALVDGSSGEVVLEPHPDPAAHPLQPELDGLRARMAAEAAEAEGRGDTSMAEVELDWETLPFPTEYTPEGLLTLPLSRLADVRAVAVGRANGGAAAAAGQAGGSEVARRRPESAMTTPAAGANPRTGGPGRGTPLARPRAQLELAFERLDGQQHEQRKRQDMKQAFHQQPAGGWPRAVVITTPGRRGPPLPSTSTATTPARGVRPPPAGEGHPQEPRLDRWGAVSASAGPSRLPGASKCGATPHHRPTPGSIVPALGGWADIAEQLRQRRQELGTPPPPLPSQAGPGEQQTMSLGPSNAPEATIPGFSGSKVGAHGSENDDVRKAPRPLEAQCNGHAGHGAGGGELGGSAAGAGRSVRKERGPAGVEAPGAVRPRGGARRVALGPMLAFLRSSGSLEQR